MTARKIVDARNAADGTISHVRLDGNRNFTSAEKAIQLADQGRIANAHVVRRANAKTHLRTNPDRQLGNNLDQMAED